MIDCSEADWTRVTKAATVAAAVWDPAVLDFKATGANRAARSPVRFSAGWVRGSGVAG